MSKNQPVKLFTVALSFNSQLCTNFQKSDYYVILSDTALKVNEIRKYVLIGIDGEVNLILVHFVFFYILNKKGAKNYC